MATIGQTLSAPENGWKRVEIDLNTNTLVSDNTGNIASMLTSTSASDGSYLNVTSSTPSEYIEFTFSGDKLRIIGSRSYNKSNNIKIDIDGTVYSYNQNNGSSSISWKVLLFEKIGLPNGSHKAKIYMDGETTPRTNGDGKYSFDVDVIDVDNNASVSKYINKILLLSKDKRVIKISNNTYSETNAIPKMTANTIPSGRAFASSFYDANYEPWKAFNKTQDNEGHIFANNTKTGYLGYEFPSNKVIGKYSLRSQATTAYLTSMPKDWELEGSNDGSSWIVLDKQNGQIWVDIKTEKFYTISNPKSFKMYRINIADNNGYRYTGVDEFSMFEVLTPQEVTSLPSHSEKNFINYGMNASSVQLDKAFTSKNYILQDTVSENEDGLWTTQLNRKPLIIRFD